MDFCFMMLTHTPAVGGGLIRRHGVNLANFALGFFFDS